MRQSRMFFAIGISGGIFAILFMAIPYVTGGATDVEFVVSIIVGFASCPVIGVGIAMDDEEQMKIRKYRFQRRMDDFTGGNLNMGSGHRET